jgi:hypothetical protein
MSVYSVYDKSSPGLQRVGAVLPKTAVDVIQLENQFDPYFTATNSGWDTLWDKQPVGHVPNLLIDDYGAWKKFLITWQGMMTDPSQGGMFSADDQYGFVVDYIRQLQTWQDLLHKYGGSVPGPPMIAPPQDPRTEMSWGAIAVGLGLGLLGLALLVRR